MSVSAFSLTLHGVTLVNGELILDSIRLNPLSSAKMISKSSITDLCRIDEARDYIFGNLIILIDFVLFNWIENKFVAFFLKQWICLTVNAPCNFFPLNFFSIYGNYFPPLKLANWSWPYDSAVEGTSWTSEHPHQVQPPELQCLLESLSSGLACYISTCRYIHTHIILIIY